MKIEQAKRQRDLLIEQLSSLVAADKLNELAESITHVCDLCFEAGRTAPYAPPATSDLTAN